jgi:hypothetical protein
MTTCLSFLCTKLFSWTLACNIVENHRLGADLQLLQGELGRRYLSDYVGHANTFAYLRSSNRIFDMMTSPAAKGNHHNYSVLKVSFRTLMQLEFLPRSTCYIVSCMNGEQKFCPKQSRTCTISKEIRSITIVSARCTLHSRKQFPNMDGFYKCLLQDSACGSEGTRSLLTVPPLNKVLIIAPSICSVHSS